MTGASMTFVVEHLGLAAWLVTQGYEYRQTGKKTFTFPPEAEAAAKLWRRRAEARSKNTSSATSNRFLTKHAADRV